MLRTILLSACIAIFFCSSFPAFADKNQEGKLKTMGYIQVTPPVNGGLDRTGPKQSPHMGISPANAETLQDRIAPEQRPFGKMLSFEKKETPTAEETPLPEPDLSSLLLGETLTVEQIIDPLRIRTKGGRILQLSGIDIPDLDQYEPGDVSIAARDYLMAVLTGKQVKLYQTKNTKKGRTNRMGYNLVHLTVRDNEKWVQGELLRNGLARVRPTVNNPELAKQMMLYENEARTKKRGLWESDKYTVLTPETSKKAINNWGIVEGRIHAVANIRNMIYLNFGPDWRSDFTIAIAPQERKMMAKEGLDARKLNNKNVRVRGWIEDYNGPFIRLSHPVWLEVLPSEHKPSNNN